MSRKPLDGDVQGKDNLTSHQRNTYVALVTPGGNFVIADQNYTVARAVKNINAAEKRGESIVIFDIFSAEPFSGLENVPHEEAGIQLDKIMIVTTSRYNPEGLIKARESGLVVPAPQGISGLNGPLQG